MSDVMLAGDSAYPTSVEFRFALDDLYARYAAVLDDGPLLEWPDLFASTSSYRVISRENHSRNLPLATISADSHGMIKDRVTAILQTLVYAPHYCRHIISGIHVRKLGHGSAIRTQANYCVIKTYPDHPSEVFQAGRYLDTVVVENGRLLFSEKVCVYDSLLVKNSLIYPV